MPKVVQFWSVMQFIDSVVTHYIFFVTKFQFFCFVKNIVANDFQIQYEDPFKTHTSAQKHVQPAIHFAYICYDTFL